MDREILLAFDDKDRKEIGRTRGIAVFDPISLGTDNGRVSEGSGEKERF